MDDLFPERPDDEFAKLCTMGADEHHLCSHVRGFLVQCEGWETLDHEKLSSVLRTLFELEDECPVCADLLTSLVGKIDRRLTDDDDAMTHMKHDFAKDGDMLVLHGAVKRQRHDARFSLELPQAVASKCLAPTTSAYMKAHPDICGDAATAGKVADTEFLSTYMASTWLENDKPGDIGLMYDAARAGTPGRDTLNTILVNCETRVSSWLPVALHTHPFHMVLNSLSCGWRIVAYRV